MKLVIAIILALVCTTIADDVKACDSTNKWFDGKACQDCPKDCKACVGKGGKASCLDCGANAGFYLAIESDAGVCKACAKDCTACRGGDVKDCYTPAADMKVGPSAITKCTGLKGCLYCSAENKCGKCEIGYKLDKEACTPCSSPGCIDCNADTAKCAKCAYWNKLDKDACTACDFGGCKDCPCTSCQPGYNFKDGKCTACSAGCADCTADQTKCTKCNSGYFLKDAACTACTAGCIECNAADQCSKCNIHFGLKDSKTCAACPKDCDTCDGDAKCSKCNTNFYVKDGGCTFCGAGCDGCGTDGACTKCTAGYIVDGKTCKQCQVGCIDCADTSKCKTCGAGTVLQKDGTCKALSPTCTFGQALKDDGTCVPNTIENCAIGNAVAGSCGQCAPGFYIKDKTCANCPNGCKACSPDAKGYIKCDTEGQDGFSFVNDTNAKIDKTGYLGKDLTYTLTYQGTDEKCMPNSWRASFTLSLNHKCVAYDSCPRIIGQQGAFGCQIEGNAVKMTLSLFAVVIATLFTL